MLLLTHKNHRYEEIKSEYTLESEENCNKFLKQVKANVPVDSGEESK